MGLGPAFATSKLLEHAGLSLKDIDLIEMNEAFAAQIVANERAFASEQFAREHLGRQQPLGEWDRNRLNVNGGAIALGHPLGATGVILLTKVLWELGRTNATRAVVSMCCGGGLGTGTVLERV